MVIMPFEPEPVEVTFVWISMLELVPDATVMVMFPLEVTVPEPPMTSSPFGCVIL